MSKEALRTSSKKRNHSGGSDLSTKMPHGDRVELVNPEEKLNNPHPLESTEFDSKHSQLPGIEQVKSFNVKAFAKSLHGTDSSSLKDRFKYLAKHEDYKSLEKLLTDNSVSKIIRLLINEQSGLTLLNHVLSELETKGNYETIYNCLDKVPDDQFLLMPVVKEIIKKELNTSEHRGALVQRASTYIQNAIENNNWELLKNINESRTYRSITTNELLKNIQQGNYESIISYDQNIQLTSSQCVKIAKTINADQTLIDDARNNKNASALIQILITYINKPGYENLASNLYDIVPEKIKEAKLKDVFGTITAFMNTKIKDFFKNHKRYNQSKYLSALNQLNLFNPNVVGNIKEDSSQRHLSEDQQAAVDRLGFKFYDPNEFVTLDYSKFYTWLQYLENTYHLVCSNAKHKEGFERKYGNEWEKQLRSIREIYSKYNDISDQLKKNSNNNLNSHALLQSALKNEIKIQNLELISAILNNHGKIELNIQEVINDLLINEPQKNPQEDALFKLLNKLTRTVKSDEDHETVQALFQGFEHENFSNDDIKSDYLKSALTEIPPNFSLIDLLLTKDANPNHQKGIVFKEKSAIEAYLSDSKHLVELYHLSLNSEYKQNTFTKLLEKIDLNQISQSQVNEEFSHAVRYARETNNIYTLNFLLAKAETKPEQVNLVFRNPNLVYQFINYDNDDKNGNCLTKFLRQTPRYCLERSKDALKVRLKLSLEISLEQNSPAAHYQNSAEALLHLLVKADNDQATKYFKEIGAQCMTEVLKELANERRYDLIQHYFAEFVEKPENKNDAIYDKQKGALVKSIIQDYQSNRVDVIESLQAALKNEHYLFIKTLYGHESSLKILEDLLKTLIKARNYDLVTNYVKHVGLNVVQANLIIASIAEDAKLIHNVSQNKKAVELVKEVQDKLKINQASKQETTSAIKTRREYILENMTRILDNAIINHNFPLLAELVNLCNEIEANPKDFVNKKTIASIINSRESLTAFIIQAINQGDIYTDNGNYKPILESIFESLTAKQNSKEAQIWDDASKTINPLILLVESNNQNVQQQNQNSENLDPLLSKFIEAIENNDQQIIKDLLKTTQGTHIIEYELKQLAQGREYTLIDKYINILNETLKDDRAEHVDQAQIDSKLNALRSITDILAKKPIKRTQESIQAAKLITKICLAGQHISYIEIDLENHLDSAVQNNNFPLIAELIDLCAFIGKKPEDYINKQTWDSLLNSPNKLKKFISKSIKQDAKSGEHTNKYKDICRELLLTNCKPQTVTDFETFNKVLNQVKLEKANIDLIDIILNIAQADKQSSSKKDQPILNAEVLKLEITQAIKDNKWELLKDVNQRTSCQKIVLDVLVSIITDKNIKHDPYGIITKFDKKIGLSAAQCEGIIQRISAKESSKPVDFDIKEFFSHECEKQNQTLFNSLIRTYLKSVNRKEPYDKSHRLSQLINKIGMGSLFNQANSKNELPNLLELIHTLPNPNPLLDAYYAEYAKMRENHPVDEEQDYYLDDDKIFKFTQALANFKRQLAHGLSQLNPKILKECESLINETLGDTLGNFELTLSNGNKITYRSFQDDQTFAFVGEDKELFNKLISLKPHEWKIIERKLIDLQFSEGDNEFKNGFENSNLFDLLSQSNESQLVSPESVTLLKQIKISDLYNIEWNEDQTPEKIARKQAYRLKNTNGKIKPEPVDQKQGMIDYVSIYFAGERLHQISHQAKPSVALSDCLGRSLKISKHSPVDLEIQNLKAKNIRSLFLDTGVLSKLIDEFSGVENVNDMKSLIQINEAVNELRNSILEITSSNNFNKTVFSLVKGGQYNDKETSTKNPKVRYIKVREADIKQVFSELNRWNNKLIKFMNDSVTTAYFWKQQRKDKTKYKDANQEIVSFKKGIDNTEIAIDSLSLGMNIDALLQLNQADIDQWLEHLSSAYQLISRNVSNKEHFEFTCGLGLKQAISNAKETVARYIKENAQLQLKDAPDQAQGNEPSVVEVQQPIEPPPHASQVADDKSLEPAVIDEQPVKRSRNGDVELPRLSSSSAGLFAKLPASESPATDKEQAKPDTGNQPVPVVRQVA